VYNMLPVKLYKPDQFHHENKTWSRMLEFFKQENTFLKNRLSEVLDHSTDKNFLALAEQFQNKFILKDEYIDELRHDINEQDSTLKDNTANIDDYKLSKRQEKLRNEMEYFEKDFNTLKNEFNKYLSTVL
jgi:seryl-tRNA synthetase